MANQSLETEYRKEINAIIKESKWDKAYFVMKSSEHKLAVAVPVEDAIMENSIEDYEFCGGGGWGTSFGINPVKNDLIMTAKIKKKDTPAQVIAITMPQREVTEDEFLDLINAEIENQGDVNNEH